MDLYEMYPLINGCKDKSMIFNSLKENELFIIEKILQANGSQIELIIPRDDNGNVVFDGEWKVNIKDSKYRATGFEMIVLKWLEDFEETGYMIELIESEQADFDSVEYSKDKKTISVEIYSNNKALGEWLDVSINLPAKEYELRDALQKLRMGRTEKYQECAVLECKIFPALVNTSLKPTTIEELNFLAKRLASLNEDECVVLRALTPKIQKETPEGHIISVKDVINYTYNLENVSVLHNVETDEELGQFVIENEALDWIKNMSDDAVKFLDKKELGKEFRAQDGGVLIEGSYVLVDEYPYEETYDGKTLPVEAKENWFAFRLLIARTPKNDAEVEKVGEKAEWLNLPIDKEDAEYLALKLGEAKIEDCVYLDFESSIAQIKDENFGDMQKFDNLNELAEIMDGLEWTDEVKFKAVLERDKPEKIEEILEIAKNIDEYELDVDMLNSNYYFREYLKRNLAPGFDKEWLSSLTVAHLGLELMKKADVWDTQYGFISPRGGALYPLVESSDKSKLLSKKFEKIEFMEKEGLYTCDKVMDEDLPTGIYKYEFRGDGFDDFCTIEKSVTVNFSGTLLLKEPLDLEKEGYQVLDEENYPEFSEEEITLQEYLDKEEEDIVKGIEMGGNNQ